MNVTKEMWVAWKADPVTKEVLGVLNKAREDLKETLATGGIDKEYLQMAIGKAMGLGEVFKIEPEWQEEEDADTVGEPSFS